jgi:hypothetical protein
MELNTLYITVHSQIIFIKKIINCTVTFIKLQYTLKYCMLHETMQSAVKNILLPLWGMKGRTDRRGKIVRGKISVL